MSQPTNKQIINWQEVEEEVVAFVRGLLQLDTRNPPGNEVRAAEYLQGAFAAEGISGEIVGPSKDRGTFIARLKGDGSAPPLLLMSHTDVVAVEPEKWTHEPFSADIADGFMYGRGALDMKQMVGMEAMIMLLLKRNGVRLKRDVIYMAAADEECGGHAGAGWVVKHRPELIQAEYALNEGGGSGLEINGRRYYPVQTAEKGTVRFRLRTFGKPGHASVPHNENAILKLATILATLVPNLLPVHFSATLRGYIAGLAATQPPEIAQALQAILTDETTADAAVDRLPFEETLKQRIHAMLRNTVTPTILAAGSQINVIPSEAEALIDGRHLPGWTPEMFLEELRSVIGNETEITLLDPSVPLEADLQSPLFDSIKEVLKEHDAEATTIPFLLTGGTDAKHVTQLGTKVYGFVPALFVGEGEGRRVHSHDERVSVRSLQWGMRVLYEVVERFVMV
ncbi:MAG TPA: M20/M25/M40 family metallo-hydrolase [Ktedonobacteraceae bacterium]|nr:M20/M25/M40 family metallo-hydrolase [Ktedonobacteraceae bacterium]